MKRLIDNATGCSLIMRLEDRHTAAVLIIEYQGRRIERLVGGAVRLAAMEAYKCRDVVAFGELIYPTRHSARAAA